MTEITYQELEEQFDEILSRVENGESFIINYEGKQVAMIPYDKYTEVVDEYAKLYIEETENIE